MAEVEIPTEAPAWMLALEKKRQRVHRLAHEVGAGSPCLLCKDDCPGLDLHFWRKICRNCKCKKEDHDVIDDCGFEQFEILLGSGHSTNRPNKAFLEMLEKHTSVGLKKKTQNVAFDWVPPDVSPDIAAEYMQSLPASKLPISGSDGALYRRQQLERQLPLHDLDADQCHQLTDAEVENLKKYLENVKNNVVGQGRVTRLTVPSSNSLDSLQKAYSFNSVPKPFQASAGGIKALPNAPPQFEVGGHVSTGQTVHLKPPSAFWPKSLSPEPLRSVSPSGDTELPSVADRGAAFGVTLSPAFGRKPLGSLNGNSPDLKSNNIDQNLISGHLRKENVPKLVAMSTYVPGNMWVPSECPECSKRVVDGHVIRDQVCVHVSMSDDISHQAQSSECLECRQKGVDGILVTGQICSHVVQSSEIPHNVQRGPCVDCVKPGSDGYLSRGQVCSHIANSSEIPNKIQTGELLRRSDLDDCNYPGWTGDNLHGPLHYGKPGQAFPLGGEALGIDHLILSNKMTPTLQHDQRHPDQSGENTPREMSPLPPPPSWMEHPLSGHPPKNSEGVSNLSGTSPCYTYHGEKIDSALVRNKSPTNVVSSTVAPHTMALYAHHALNSPSGLEPQDHLSPHIASMSIDDNSLPGICVDSEADKFSDAMLPVDQKLQCVQCTEGISPGDVVVCADRAGLEVLWHPQCFVCNICQELLVDLVYFFNKGHVYCGRHYAEILDIPRCNACDELIFVKEYTVAEGQTFHVKHFCCFECDDPLGGKQYVPKDGQPVCLPCYERKYGKQCETCHLMIGAQDQRVSWKDFHWHATATCFCCSTCQKSLLGGRFAVRDQRPFCSKECMQALPQKMSAV